MTMKNLRLYLPVLLLTLFLISCGEDDGDGDGNSDTGGINCSDPSGLTESAQELVAISLDYSNDPTNNALCGEYLNATRAYIDDLDEFIRNCENAGVDLTQWEAAINQWETAVTALPCN